MELGIYSFGDMGKDPISGEYIDAGQRLRNLLEEIQLADQLGLDVFALGEHHREEYSVSSPALVLAAAASQTNNIKLSSAVTVLSSDDPVRVYQQFASLDLISGGRAEIMAGRGSFIESFPLFGYDLDDYDELFSEKLELLVKVNKNEIVDWKGKMRPEIDHKGIYPRASKELPIWVAIGGTPASVVRAAQKNLHMALAIIGGEPARFAPFVKYYREALAASGHDVSKSRVGINSMGFIADDSQDAANIFYPSYAAAMTKIGKERGWGPTNREQYEWLRMPKGCLLVGSPQQVIDKLLYQYELFGNNRFLMQMCVGVLPHHKMMKSIELYGTKVLPVIKKELRNVNSEINSGVSPIL